MNMIALLDQKDFDPTIDMFDRPNYKHRLAARAVLVDKDGAVALMHATTQGYYKLPGGGIDEGEKIEDALARELLEEAGVRAEVTAELGMVEEWRDTARLHQVSYCFAARVVGAKGAPTLTEKEIAAGFEVVWVPTLEQAIALVESSTVDDETGIGFMIRREIAILQTALKAGV